MIQLIIRNHIIRYMIWIRRWYIYDTEEDEDEDEYTYYEETGFE